MKISVITGRRNHKCKFLEDRDNAIPRIKREVNANLHDIFSGKKKEVEEAIGDDNSANNEHLPCKIIIKDKNVQKMKQYLKENTDVNEKNFLQWICLLQIY